MVVRKTLNFHYGYACEIILETLSDVQKPPIVKMYKSVSAIHLYTDNYKHKMSD